MRRKDFVLSRENMLSSIYSERSSISQARDSRILAAANGGYEAGSSSLAVGMMDSMFSE